MPGYDYAPHERSPYDLGLDRFVRLDARGPTMADDELRRLSFEPRNRFKTIRLGGDVLPEYGAIVTKGTAEIGVLTSPVLSERHGAIGLAILQAEEATDGTRVEVVATTGTGTVSGEVDVLSIHDPARVRPRSWIEAAP